MKKKTFLLSLLLILLVALIGCTNSTTNSETNSTKKMDTRRYDERNSLLYLAEYPEYADRPIYDDYKNYNEYQKALEEYDQKRSENSFKLSECDSLSNFIKNTLSVVTENDGLENTLYSPYNVYQALSILAETTSNETRQELLDLLNVDSIEDLRRDNKKLFNSLYKNGKNYITNIGSSIWLRRNENLYNDDTLSLIKENYFCSSYSGDMGQEYYNKEFRNWMNQMTNNILSEQVKELSFDTDTMFAIISTLYYKTSFNEAFNEEFNVKDDFTNGDSSKTKVTYMKKTETLGVYIATKFTAISLKLNDEGYLKLVLPNTGYTNNDLKNDPEYLNYLLNKVGTKIENKSVKMMIPKFDVSSKLDLITSLKTLGVTKIFKANESDFSSLVENCSGLIVDKILHGVRVKVDEKGIEGAAYTFISNKETAIIPEDEIDFILNRPFTFIVNSSDDIPIFIGEVNNLK